MALLVGVLAVTGRHIQIVAQSADPFVGTWELDVKASRFKPTAYTRSVMKIEAIKEQRKITVDSELDGGAVVQYEFVAAYDGKDYPMTFLTADSVVLKRIDERTIEWTLKQGGQANAVSVSRLSTDGRTMTVIRKGTSPRGLPTENVLVYKRR